MLQSLCSWSLRWPSWGGCDSCEAVREGGGQSQKLRETPPRGRAARFWARAGGPGGGAATREDLALPLRDLHQDIHATIEAEVCLFWLAAA
jgi:hypothetical protein